jgi:hypothetical protein
LTAKLADGNNSSMSTAELRELVASILLSQKETSLQMKENRESQKETDKQLKELGKQIGGLGNKFGTFAEGLSYRSIVRILREKFQMNDFVAPGVHVRRDGLEEEYDILAYSNDTLDRGMIVEIKSSLRKEDIAQMQRKMDGVFKMLPEHRGKTFQGMIACVSGTADLKRQIIESGWYLAHIGDDLFEMETPEDFVAKTYSAGLRR